MRRLYLPYEIEPFGLTRGERVSRDEVSLRPGRNQRTSFTIHALRVLLGLISLLMVSDFLLRGVALAFRPGRTDFSEIYTGAWLWRHGQNFYDSVLLTRTHEQLVHASVQIAPIYLPQVFALASPLTYLSWGWANLVWLLLCFAGIGATVFLLLHLRGFSGWDSRTIALGTLLLSFDPFHIAFHVGNIALLVVPLCLWVVLLAEKRQDFGAGLILGVAAALKPQIAVWILLYYLLQFRRAILLGSVVGGIAVSAIVFVHPVALTAAISSYHSNLRLWLGPGQPLGFTEGALASPLRVSSLQAILFPMMHSLPVSNLCAHVVFLSGLVLAVKILWQAQCRLSPPLAISSLLALSFLSLYHSMGDTTVLTLALCWAVPAEGQPWTRPKILTCVLFFLMMLPGYPVLMRLAPHLAPSLTSQWWWRLFVERYFVWLLLALNIMLLAGLWDAARCVRKQQEFGRSSLCTNPNSV